MKQNKVVYYVLKAIVKPILKVMYRYKVINGNNIPKEGGYILACNHIAFTDPILLAVTQKRRIFFMAKIEIFRNKFLTWFFTLIGAFPVNRAGDDGKAVNTGIDIIKEGNVMGIFIEGTRSKNRELLRPRSGCALVAQETQVPVIPACITVPSKRRFFAKHIVHYGEPLSVEELGLTTGDRRELRKATNMIMDKIREMREQDLNAYKRS